MNCKQDIINLADSKLKSSKLLLDNGFYDDAFYIGGYAIELLLKAKVCDTLGIDNFFEEQFLKSKLKNPQTYKNHDLDQLLLLSGLFPKHATELADPDFKTCWSLVISWNEGSRYLTGKVKKDAEDFLTSVNKISEWIKKNL